MLGRWPPAEGVLRSKRAVSRRGSRAGNAEAADLCDSGAYETYAFSIVADFATPSTFCHLNSGNSGESTLKNVNTWSRYSDCITDGMRTEAELNQIAGEIIAGGIAIHQAIGPGCFESAYAPCLAYEFHRRRLRYQMKVPISIHYEGLIVPRAYEADFIVSDDVVVELKATSANTAVDARQLLTYLRFTGCPLGLLMNFGALTLLEGIKRIVNNFPEGSSPSGTHGPPESSSQTNCPVREKPG
jgi:GxxExxY protein